jgi:hypothetical protein
MQPAGAVHIESLQWALLQARNPLQVHSAERREPMG